MIQQIEGAVEYVERNNTTAYEKNSNNLLWLLCHVVIWNSHVSCYTKSKINNRDAFVLNINYRFTLFQKNSGVLFTPPSELTHFSPLVTKNHNLKVGGGGSYNLTTWGTLSCQNLVFFSFQMVHKTTKGIAFQILIFFSFPSL